MSTQTDMDRQNKKTTMEITGDKFESRFLIMEVRKELQKQRTSRAVALAITKLQEAEYWLGEALYSEDVT